MSSSDISSMFSSFTGKLKPFGDQLSRQINQVQQLAKEAIGAAPVGDVTELPPEFKSLEYKMDRVKAMFDSFQKVSRTFTVPHNDYEPPLQDTVTDFASSVQGNVFGFAAIASERFNASFGSGQQSDHVHQQSGTTTNDPFASPKSDIPKCLAFAVSKTCADTSADLGTEEPLGAALNKMATTYDRIGAAKLAMDDRITVEFFNKCNIVLANQIEGAIKARRNVQTARLTYDASRARLKAASPDRVDAVRVEMEKFEDEFVATVEDAMTKMKLVVENNFGIKLLCDFVEAQLAYHKEAYEALTGLSPELKELKVTQDALMSASFNN